MKQLYKRIGLAMVAFSLLILVGCETTELDVVDSPNDLSPAQASVDFFLNQVQLMTAQVHSGEEGRAENGLSQFGMEPVRIQHGFGPNYRENYAPSDYDRVWDNVYARALIDIRTMNTVAEEGEQFTHIAIGQILEAYLMMSMVDFFGDVPYSEAARGSEGILNPAVDSGADIYAALDQLLLDAIANLNRQEFVLPANDLFYGGDESQWVKVANTMRLKLYLQTRLVNPSESTSVINSLIADGDLILDPADDFFFQWGTNLAAPDSRHPYFDANFDGAGPSSDFYTCNYFMDLMANQYGEPDPRIRYYFYRQQGDFSAADVVTKECVTFVGIPAWWDSSDPYCLVPATNGLDGYWGRNHLDDDGIPPDDQLRTVLGVYPAGGPFDDDSFRNVAGSTAVNEGLVGAGISPLLMSSYTYFMLAEAALELGTTGDARTYLEQGIRQSINLVVNFGERLGSTVLDRVLIEDDPDTPENEERTVRDFYVPTTTQIDSHVNEILTAYDAGNDTDKLRIIVEQYFIALWGSGIEAYNTYRRTGQPDDVTPAFTLADPGTFLRSHWYSQTATNSNINLTQKSAPDTPVFWDTNPDGFVD